jgi:hypothetical protein
MFSIIKRLREDAKQGFEVTDCNGDVYKPLIFAGKVNKSSDVWAYVIAVGPYYIIFNKRKGE